jgi:CRISPR-associated protein Csm4
VIVPTYAVYLYPRSSYASAIGSDTLFGALCWAVRELWGVEALTDLLQRFPASGSQNAEALPPFSLSSAFPFLYHDGEKVRFYPKLLLPEPTGEQIRALAEQLQRRNPLRPHRRAVVAAIEKVKRIKGTAYVSEDLFAQIVRGELDVFNVCEHLVERGSTDQDVVLWGPALITHGERRRLQAQDLKAFLAEGDVQRNEIERVALATVEGRLFFTHETYLHRRRAGLWFVLCTEDLDFLKPLLRYLADTGLGGERSVGKGHFDINLQEVHEIELSGAADPNGFVTLSRYIPLAGECDFEREPLSYVLTTLRPKHEAKMAGRGHRVYKRLLRVFEPGSVLPLTERKAVYGQVVRVGRSAEGAFEAYHNGMAVPVFAQIAGGSS